MLKLMIVDDEPLIINRLINDIDFEAIGYVVCATAHSAKQALKLLQVVHPDVLLVDIMMPDMNGLELIEAIRKNNSNMNIIILSGYDNFSFAQRALELKVHQYLLKPVNPESLCNILSSLATQRSMYSSVQPKTFESLADSLKGKHIVATIEVRPGKSQHIFPKALSILEHIAKDIFPASCISVIETPFFHLLIPYNDKVLRMQQVIEKLRRLRRQFLNEWEEICAVNSDIDRIYCHIGVGYPAAGKFELLRSKQVSIDMLEQAYFSEDSSLAVYEQHTQNSQKKPQSHSITLSEIKKEVSSIVYNIIHADLSSATSHLRKYFDSKYRNTHENRQNFLIECNLFYLLIGLLIEESGFSGIVAPAERFYDTISSLEDYFSVLEYFESELSRISTQITGINIDSDNSIIFRIKQYILKNYRRNITLKELSENVYLSTSYLSSYFKKKTGQTITEYLVMIRIEQAKHLLVESNLTVNQIAEQVGYPGYRYFCTLFKQVTGVTPIHYRLNHMSYRLNHMPDRMIKEG